MEIAIMRYHPLHQDSLDSHLGNQTTRPQAVLLVGKVLGVRRAKNGVVAFMTANLISGELTIVNVPAPFTAINPDGGQYTKAIALGNRRGPVIWYPTWIPARDFQTPKS